MFMYSCASLRRRHCMKQSYEEIQSLLDCASFQRQKIGSFLKVPNTTLVNISFYRYKSGTKMQKLLRLLALALSLQLQQLLLITMKTNIISTLIKAAAFNLPLRVFMAEVVIVVIIIFYSSFLLITIIIFTVITTIKLMQSTISC